jgi:ribosomal-protein-alanine N-acetyltransferase
MCKINNDITIRLMDMSDVPFVYQQETVEFGQKIEEKALYKEIIENKIARYYIALKDSERIGYIGGWMPGPYAEIITIFVKEQFRKQNIGHRLLTHLIEQAVKEDIESITLEVRPTNVSAIALYRSFGFAEIGLRKQYYKDGEDALMMYLMIGGNT